MDWIHCNNCFSLPDNDRNFFLTSCGHIYCCDCKESCSHEKCKLCGNQCSVISLSSSMAPNVQAYFTDPYDLLRKKIKEVYQVAEFQKTHRTRLMSHQRKQIKKFQAMREDVRKLLKNLKDIDNERKKASQENEMLKRYLNECSQRNNYPSYAVPKLDRERSRSHDGSSPHPNFNDLISKFSEPNLHGRLSVISPPINGKLGFIPGTPSPSQLLKDLNLHNVFDARRYADTPSSANMSRISGPSPGSLADSFKDIFATPNNPMNTFRKSVKKVVVHPYSPDDSPVGSKMKLTPT